MSVTLAITGRTPVEFDSDLITLGSDPHCSVLFPATPDLKPNHAVIRLIDGRWVIEVRDAEAFFLDGNQPKKAHWLNSGDVIHLSENGPAVKFELPVAKPTAPAPKPTKKMCDVIPLPDSDPSIPTTEAISKTPKKASDVVRLPDSDPLIPVTKPEPTAKARVPKPPSSAIIQVPKSPSSSMNIPKPKSPSSSTNIPVPKSPLSSMNIPTSKSSSSIPKPPSSMSMRVPKSPSSSTMKTSNPPSSGSVRSTKSSGDSHVERNSSGKAPKSESGIPAKGAKRPSSSTHLPIDDSDAAEPVAGLPVLKRLSSYEAPVASVDEEDLLAPLDDSPIRRKRGSQDADIQWIKMLIIRCFAAGLVVLILWIAITELWKSFGSTKESTSAAAVLMDRSANPVV